MISFQSLNGKGYKTLPFIRDYVHLILTNKKDQMVVSVRDITIKQISAKNL